MSGPLIARVRPGATPPRLGPVVDEVERKGTGGHIGEQARVQNLDAGKEKGRLFVRLPAWQPALGIDVEIAGTGGAGGVSRVKDPQKSVHPRPVPWRRPARPGAARGR